MTKRIAGAMALIGILVVLVVSNAACQQEGPTEGVDLSACPVPVAPPSARVQALADDLRLLKLLNRLQFTPEQIQALLPAVDALQAQRVAFDQKITALDGNLEQALREQRTLLVADKPLAPEVQQRVSDLQEQRSDQEEQAVASLSQAAAGLRQLMTAPQIAIVSGSYEAQLQAREMLEWLRSLSDNDFTEEAAANAEGLASPEQGLDETLLMNLFNTARKLSATDYAKSEDELAQRLAPAYGLTASEANERIAGAFANPQMPSLLREKAAVSGEGAG